MNSLRDTLCHLNIITNLGKLNPKSQQMLDKAPVVLDAILSYTEFLSPDVELRARLHCVQYGITSKPVCRMCNSDVTFNKQKRRFNEYCSNKCGWDDPVSVSKNKQTKLKNTDLKTTTMLIRGQLPIQIGTEGLHLVTVRKLLQNCAILNEIGGRM